MSYVVEIAVIVTVGMVGMVVMVVVIASIQVVKSRPPDHIIEFRV